MGVFTDHQPAVVEVETTTYCNRRCDYCPNSIFDRGQRANEVQLPDNLWRQITDDLGANRFVGQFSPLGYGEPLADRRLPDLMAYARTAMPLARLAIYTNGDHLTPALFAQFSNTVDSWVITQHGDTIPPGLQAVLDTRDPRIRFRTSTQIWARASNRGGLLDLPVRRRLACGLVMSELHIDAHGRLKLCCEDYHSAVTFGSITNRTLEEAWTDPRRLELHRRNLTGDFVLPQCKACGYAGAVVDGLGGALQPDGTTAP